MFGTSHSSTTSRVNVLLSIYYNGICGYGEVGLPPVLFGCYEGDASDLIAYSNSFCKYFDLIHDFDYDPFVDSDGFFDDPPPIIQRLFYCLDTFPGNEETYCRVGRCLFEFAIFDLWGKLENKRVSTLLHTINFFKYPTHRSFYTVGLGDVNTMCQNVLISLKYTPLLKIKLNSDLKRCKQILESISEIYSRNLISTANVMWAIDANASWVSPETALEFLDILIPFKNLIYMVEQPFPLFRAKQGDNSKVCLVDSKLKKFFPFCTRPADVSSSSNQAQLNIWNGWIGVKEAYGQHGINIFGDESICTADDVIALQEIVHGVNVKCEKAGGYRGAVKALLAAKSLSCLLWLGTMVGSALNCTAAAQLIPLVEYGDIDASLLILDSSQRFDSGYSWSSDRSGAISMFTDASAIGGLGMKKIH